MPTNLDLKLLKGQELGPLNDASKANLVKEKKDRLHPFQWLPSACEKTAVGWQTIDCNLRKKCCTVPVLTKILPNRALKPGIVWKDDDPFPWRNAFWGALFTMAQAALACQIAPALDTDEDSSSLHFRAWHEGSSESHRRESSKIGPSKKLHRWLRKNIAWNCLERCPLSISKKSCEDLQALYNWVRPAEFWKRESLHQMKTRWFFLNLSAWYWWCCRAAGWINILKTTEKHHRFASGVLGIHCQLMSIAPVCFGGWY